MQFSEKDKKELENQLNKMAMASILGIMRGVDGDLQTETTKVHKEFQEKCIEYYSSAKFNNENLTIMKNFFEQGIKIINDIMEE